jgi:acetyl-CoA carboxylase biotin carboxyl carrier protein
MAKKKTSGDELAEYLKFMEEKNLHELEIRDGETHIKLVRQSKQPIYEPLLHAAPAKAVSPKKEEKPTPEEGVPVKSPLAGVFYRARSPQAPAFVNVGDNVTAEQPLCIIEAMKVMNEIVAGNFGRVVKILVENGKPVEANQTLFILKQE